MEKLKPRIIITADDFGYCDCRSRGVKACLFSNGGLVSSISALVSPSFANGCLSVRDVLDGSTTLGLHLNLTEGLPCCGGAKTLTNDQGQFWDKFELRRRCDLQMVDNDEIEQEIRAQILQFEKMFGQFPEHIDGHQVTIICIVLYS